MRIRTMATGIVAIGLPLVLMTTVVGVGAAWATTGTGYVSCSKITGTLTFKPPLKNSGTSTETTTTKTTETGCSGGTPNPTKITGVSTHKATTNSCSGLETATSVTIKLTFTPTVTASTFKGTATPSTSPPGFTLSGSTTGSYAAAKASATVVLKQTEAQILAACKSSAGLKSLTIKSGSSTSGPGGGS